MRGGGGGGAATPRSFPLRGPPPPPPVYTLNNWDLAVTNLEKSCSKENKSTDFYLAATPWRKCETCSLSVETAGTHLTGWSRGNLVLDLRAEDGTLVALSTGACDGELGQDANLRPRIMCPLTGSLGEMK